MKSYLSLIPISAKVRKRQNRMTMLCIIISVLLVTMIFSMADMAIRMEKTRVIKEHGNWHIMLKEPSEQQIEQIAQRTDVMTSSRYDGLNFDLSEDYTINGKSCVIVGGDNAILTEIYDNLTEGRYPTKENEILLSNRSKELLSLKIGEAITVHTPAGDFGYTISGFGGDVTLWVYGSGFSKIRKHWSVIRTLFHRTAELRQCDHRHIQLSGKSFQRTENI